MASSYVTINGLRLDVEGFVLARDLVPLMQQAGHRGSNFVSQGVDGSTFRAKPTSELTVMLPLLIFGDNDSTGTPHADTLAGLRANYDAVYDACVAASKSALVTCTLTFSDASTISGSVHCPQMDVAMHTDRDWQTWAAVLEIVVPAGALT